MTMMTPVGGGNFRRVTILRLKRLTAYMKAQSTRKISNNGHRQTRVAMKPQRRWLTGGSAVEIRSLFEHCDDDDDDDGDNNQGLRTMQGRRETGHTSPGQRE
jgi:hypothetical protein